MIEIAIALGGLLMLAVAGLETIWNALNPATHSQESSK